MVGYCVLGEQTELVLRADVVGGRYRGVFSSLLLGALLAGCTIDHPDYGASWRQADFDFFTSEACRRLLAEQKIKLVTWKEIRD